MPYAKREGVYMEDIEKILYKTLYYFMVFLMLTMVTIIFIQVIARYIVHNSLTWSEEIGRYTFVWITFFGTALAVKERSHVALDILIKKLPTLLKKIITPTAKILRQRLRPKNWKKRRRRKAFRSSRTTPAQLRHSPFLKNA